KKLVDAGHGQIVTHAVQFNESRPYKARLRRNITGKTERTHPSSVLLQMQSVGKGIYWRFARQCHIVIEIEHLHIERRIVGKHAQRIIIDFHSAPDALNSNASLTVCYYPVKLGGYKFVAERFLENAY